MGGPHAEEPSPPQTFSGACAGRASVGSRVTATRFNTRRMCPRLPRSPSLLSILASIKVFSTTSSPSPISRRLQRAWTVLESVSTSWAARMLQQNYLRGFGGIYCNDFPSKVDVLPHELRMRRLVAVGQGELLKGSSSTSMARASSPGPWSGSPSRRQRSSAARHLWNMHHHTRAQVDVHCSLTSPTKISTTVASSSRFSTNNPASTM